MDDPSTFVSGVIVTIQRERWEASGWERSKVRNEQVLSLARRKDTSSLREAGRSRNGVLMSMFF